MILLLARTQFARALSSRRSWIVLALACLPALLALLLTRFATKVPTLQLTTSVAWLIFLQVILPLMTLLAGSAVIAQEVEDRTITYLFTRPLARWVVFLGRFLGTLAFVASVAALAVALFLLAARSGAARGANQEVFPFAPWAQDGVTLPLLSATMLGSVAYTALFAALGVWTRLPMIFGLAYCFAIEGFLSNLPGSSQSLTVQHYVRSWIAGQSSGAWNLVEGFQSASYDSPLRALVTLLAIAALALALGVWRIGRREYVLPS